MDTLLVLLKNGLARIVCIPSSCKNCLQIGKILHVILEGLVVLQDFALSCKRLAGNFCLGRPVESMQRLL